MTATFDLFSVRGSPAKSKILFLGSPDPCSEALMNQARSLKIEHVSLAGLMRREISRHRDSVAANEASVLAAMRKWFFSRKPDAGFVLWDFPATLLQAQVLDEWLDARDETLDAVALTPTAPLSIASHYRTLGVPSWELGIAV